MSVGKARGARARLRVRLPTNMTRRYGRAPQGERLVCKVPHGHWKTTTFIAALRHDRVTAPLALDGPMNGVSFKAYVEQVLAPTLKSGDIGSRPPRSSWTARA